MLPRLLCDRLCSLNPNEDRLTYSVIWTMNSTGEVSASSPVLTPARRVLVGHRFSTNNSHVVSFDPVLN